MWHLAYVANVPYSVLESHLVFTPGTKVLISMVQSLFRQLDEHTAVFFFTFTLIIKELE